VLKATSRGLTAKPSAAGEYGSALDAVPGVHSQLIRDGACHRAAAHPSDFT